MKIGNYDITFSNIKSFIQGHSKYLVDKFGSGFIRLPSYQKEQVLYRYERVNDECKKAGNCTQCGCPVNQMVYADKSCEKNCYPVMMSKEEWTKYKENEHENKKEIKY